MTNRRLRNERSFHHVLASEAPYRLREFHAFEAAGIPLFVCGAERSDFCLEGIGQKILGCVSGRGPQCGRIMEWLLSRGHSRWDVETALMEMEESEVIMRGDRSRNSPKCRRAISAAAHRLECHKPVQPGLRLLLRVQRQTRSARPMESRSIWAWKCRSRRSTC